MTPPLGNARLRKARAQACLNHSQLWLIIGLWLSLILGFTSNVHAQLLSNSEADGSTISDRLSHGSNGKKSPMVVEAQTMVYNNDAQTVTAAGDAQIYYEGKVLEADQVTYYKKTGHVTAEGSVKLTEPNGSVTHGDYMDLTGDFKDGFINSVRVDSAERTHFSSPRVERTDGDVTVFDKGSYTACPSCAENPTKPPVWRIRARKIIHRNKVRMLYYENAWFDVFGVPIAYLPFLSTADPTVTRESGLLLPMPRFRSTTGFGLGLPIFWVINKSTDLTFTPNFLTKQGVLGQLQFRQRTDNGYYYVDLNGIHQNRSNVFAANPWGSGKLQNRGSIQSQGLFALNSKWKFGWDITRYSDKWFLNDYGLPHEWFDGAFFRQSASSVYLTGQGERSYFDLRGIIFQSLANSDYQPQLASVWPMLDYNKTIDIDPARSHGIGGQIEIDGNLTHSSATAATYQQIGYVSLDRAYGLFPVCRNTAGQPDYNQSNCLLRGLGGNFTSGTLSISWQRKIIDPIGEIWTPFAFARAYGSYLSYNTTRSFVFQNNGVTDTIYNSSQQAFLTRNNRFNGAAAPGVGMEWRYPLFGQTSIGDLVIEPIAQIIARPNGENPNTLLNLDAQSLVFDTSNLFEWNKYSGYDRFETGVRANYGAQLTLDAHQYGAVNANFGQSRQIAGRNSYAMPDSANTGLSSGLDTPASDYVARASYAPSTNLTFVSKMRFDQRTWQMRRLDVAANAKFGSLTLGTQYADYIQQPLIGYNERREGLGINIRYDILPNYFMRGDIMYDLSRYHYNPYLSAVSKSPVFSIAGYGLGAGYHDDCTSFSVSYSDVISDNYGNPATYTRNRTVLLSLELRTLGSVKAPISLTPSRIQDGLKY